MNFVCIIELMHYNKPEKIRIRYKLFLLSLISLMGMIIVLLFFNNAIEKNLYKEKKNKILEAIETGKGVISYFHDLETGKTLDGNTARKYAMESLSNAVFGEDGYFWINNTSGQMLMHPKMKELVDKDSLELQDTKGSFIMKEFIEKAVSGGGWVEYYWPKPSIGDESEYLKISYVEYFEPWKWVIGSGFYVDNIKQEIRKTSIEAIQYIAVIFFIIIMVSIYYSMKFMRQLKNLAITDNLTNLYTRLYLKELVPMLLSYHERNLENHFAVIMLDIDFFKKVNDSYGHSAGDKVLKVIAKIIQSHLRKNDLCVRYGGEEFVIATLCKSKMEVINVIERIRKLVAEHVFVFDDQKVNVTLSAGIAFREDLEPFSLVLKKADENLYSAKETGRNKIVFN